MLVTDLVIYCSMIGEADSQAAMWSYRVNLDKRVRIEHPLRRINAVLDLSFVRGQVAHTYGRKGNKSVPPEVIVRMMMLLFLDDIKSERELMRIIPERLDYLWFLGYGLDDEIPNHSVLSKARKRWGKELFVTLFSRVVHQCVEAGLVEGRKIHVDASLVDANASWKSVQPLAGEVSRAIERTAREQLLKLDERDEDVQEGPPASSGTQAEGKANQNAPVNRKLASLSDPDATLVRRSGIGNRPRYKTHRAVDDAHEIITALETTTGIIDEGAQLFALIEAHEDITGQRAQTVIGDARYGNINNLLECQKRQIRPHLRLLGDTYTKKTLSQGLYTEEHFPYDPLSDTYRCPAGQSLRARRLHPQRRIWEYVTSKGTCSKCPLRKLCTTSAKGRRLHRHQDQALLDRARQIAHSKAAKRDLKRRQHLMERSFADAANCHGLKRARWRGLWKQAIQDLLIATVQNLRKLVRFLSQTQPKLANRLVQLLQQLQSLLSDQLPVLPSL